MADLDMSVVISRDNLALGPLEINDGYIYQIGDQFLGGQVSYDRQEVGGPNTDGSLTTGRTLQKVQEPVAVEVWGRTNLDASLRNAALQANIDALSAAFMQNTFTLSVTIDTAVWEYSGEAADVQITWMGTRFMAKKGKVTFTVPRQPRELLRGLL